MSRIRSYNEIILILLLVLSEKGKNEFLLLIVLFQLIIYILKYGIYIRVFNICKYLIYIFIIAFIMSSIHIFYNNYLIKDILRDSYIMITPIVYIFYGAYCCYLGKNDKISIFRSVVTAGIIISLIHISKVILNINIVLLDINNRDIAGTGSVITIIAIIILNFSYKNNVKIFAKNRKRKFIKNIILIISFILYFSRTDIALLLCFLGSIMLIHKKINIIKISKVSILSIIMCVAIYVILPKNIVHTFINKTINSINEVSSESTEIWDWYSINNNWRGYEVYRSKETINNGNILDIALGYGMGKAVELNTEILLGEQIYSRITILHNGYYYLLLKSGIFGLIMYILFLIKILFINIKSIISENKVFESQLLCGVSLGIIFSTIVVSGIYNKGSIFSYCLIIGYFSVYNSKEVENTKLGSKKI